MLAKTCNATASQSFRTKICQGFMETRVDRKTLASKDTCKAWSNKCCFSFICMCASEGLGGTLSVVCGSQPERNTASATNKNNLDVTILTADILSEELKYDHRIGMFF